MSKVKKDNLDMFSYWGKEDKEDKEETVVNPKPPKKKNKKSKPKKSTIVDADDKPSTEEKKTKIVVKYNLTPEFSKMASIHHADMDCILVLCRVVNIIIAIVKDGAYQDKIAKIKISSILKKAIILNLVDSINKVKKDKELAFNRAEMDNMARLGFAVFPQHNKIFLILEQPFIEFNVDKITTSPLTKEQRKFLELKELYEIFDMPEITLEQFVRAMQLPIPRIKQNDGTILDYIIAKSKFLHGLKSDFYKLSYYEIMGVFYGY